MTHELWSQNRWLKEPFQELRRMERDMERMFEDGPVVFPGAWVKPMRTGSDAAFAPACDLEETENHYLVSLDLPGVSKDEIKVEVVGNQLTVSGVRKSEAKEERKGYCRSEREHGQFFRSFALPAEVDANKVEAHFQEGVLRIALPKSEASKAKTHLVKVGEGKAGWWDKFLGRSEKIKEIASAKTAA